MTVSYTAEVTSGSGIGCFLKLLKRWRGSIYKLVWVDLIILLGIYYALNITYYYALTETQKENFKTVIKYCEKYSNLIPLSFVLGFFINIVYTRWWSQFTSIPYPDNIAILVGASIKGQDEKSRRFRRTIVRYVCVTFTMTMSLISPKIKKRFPTLLHFVDSGLLSEEEAKIIEEIDNEYPNHTKFWLPLAWASTVTTSAREEGVIKDDHCMIVILEYINEFRTKCTNLLNFDWISIPLVYTQVVTIAVYGYFLIKVIGSQSIVTEGNIWLSNFPFMLIVEFFFYMGWLKVAEALINPFGSDDDDFETSWFVDRNVQICYLLVDRVHQNQPKLIRDAYWDEVAPQTLPYTVASQSYISEHPEYSTNNVEVKNSEQEMLIPETITEVDSPDNKHGKRFRFGKRHEKFRFRRGVPLKRIVTGSNEHLNQPISDKDIETQQQGSIKSENEQQGSLKSESLDEFEHLKQKRMKQHTDKIHRYIENLKSQQYDENLLEM